MRPNSGLSADIPAATVLAPTPGVNSARPSLADLILSPPAQWDTTALVAAGESLSHRELRSRATRLALRLLDAGLGPQSFVAVAAGRSSAAIIGMLGVILAGGAYVPVGVDTPRERLRLITETAGITFITGARTVTDVPSGVVWLPALTEEPPRQGIRLPTALCPYQPAYTIFTSGTTGQPKGVVVQHGAAAQSTLARFEKYPHLDMRYLILAPLTTDAAVAGLYFALAAGGTVVLPSEEEILDPQLLADLITREGVTHVDGLPSQYFALLEFHPDCLKRLRCVVVGGETLPAPVVQRHLELLPHVELHNEYGPTEATVWSTTHRCDGVHGSSVPIGSARPGATVRVLSESLEPTSEIGEIYISGDALALGYLQRPALTAQCFVANPDPLHPGERMYRSGDLGQWSADDELIFHGRSDNLVKVRGYRIELSEIETALYEHPAVRDAVVVPHAGQFGARLSAIVVFSAGSVVGRSVLARFLAERLPPYMIPTTWRVTDTLPLTGNGKVDRRLLESTAGTAGRPLAA